MSERRDSNKRKRQLKEKTLDSYYGKPRLSFKSKSPERTRSTRHQVNKKQNVQKQIKHDIKSKPHVLKEDNNILVPGKTKFYRSILNSNKARLQKCVEEFNPYQSKTASDLSTALLCFQRGVSLRQAKIIPPEVPEFKAKSNEVLIKVAQKQLEEWRNLNLVKTDHLVSAPDYDDEYEFDNERYAWTKLYTARVLQFTNKTNSYVFLGDSSQKQKTKYKLKEHESALLVHYVDFPDWQKQWFLTQDPRVIPLDSHMELVNVLDDVLKREEIAALPDHVMEDPDKKTLSVSEITQPEPYDHSSWICVVCREAEYNSDPSIALIICEGNCNRAFHYKCAGLGYLPKDNERWVCEDCTSERHACAICHVYGNDDEEVLLCMSPNCGLYFHPSCLMTQYGIEVQEINEEDDDDEEEDFEDFEKRKRWKKFRCPAHSCWTCQRDHHTKWGGIRKADLYRCMVCPNAFHVQCIPPKARFHELALLCHEHCDTYKLPDLDLSQSMQGELEAYALEMEQKDRLQKDKKKKMGFCTFIKEDNNANQLNYSKSFQLPCNYLREVYSKPPPYKHISRNRYDPQNRPARLKAEDDQNNCCACGESKFLDEQHYCSDTCLNRILLYECIGPRKGPKRNKYQNCQIEHDCGNRRLQLNQVIRCKPVREPSKGWGLITLESVKRGDLVQEYVGEVIDEEEMLLRLHKWSEEHPHDHEYYIMKLMTDWYLDARMYGNLSRFINHSCEPNCHLVPMNVGGNVRIGIYALKDIEIDQFLTYDYRLDSCDARQKFICRCGTASCRGTFKSKNNQHITTPPPQPVFQEEPEKNQPSQAISFAVNQTGFFTSGGSERVLTEPSLKSRALVQKHRVFIWRNLMQCIDLERKFELLNTKNDREKNIAKKLDIVSLLNKRTYDPNLEETKRETLISELNNLALVGAFDRIAGGLTIELEKKVKLHRIFLWRNLLQYREMKEKFLLENIEHRFHEKIDEKVIETMRVFDIIALLRSRCQIKHCLQEKSSFDVIPHSSCDEKNNEIDKPPDSISFFNTDALTVRSYTDFVAGPKFKSGKEIKFHRIFLWRNLLKCGDLECKYLLNCNSRRKSNVKHERKKVVDIISFVNEKYFPVSTINEVAPKGSAYHLLSDPLCNFEEQDNMKGIFLRRNLYRSSDMEMKCESLRSKKAQVEKFKNKFTVNIIKMLNLRSGANT